MECKRLAYGFSLGQVKARQETEVVRQVNDRLRLQCSNLERQVMELQAELSSAKVKRQPAPHV